MTLYSYLSIVILTFKQKNENSFFFFPSKRLCKTLADLKDKKDAPSYTWS